MLLVFGACHTDYLTPEPKTSLGELQAFDTKDRIVGQVNGMYAMMKSGQFLGGRYFVYNDIRGDNFLPKSTNLVTGYATWNHNTITSTNEVRDLWGAVYAAVNAINIFLEGLDAKWSGGSLSGIITEAEYNQYRSEALALRAISYFSMLQLYAQPYNKNNGSSPGLPLRLKANKTGADNDLARSTVAEVYTQILSDLNTAEGLAATNHGSALLNTTRIHRNTIIAYKTRVYLHMNNFAQVQTEANKIVSANAPFSAPAGVAHALAPTFAGVWAAPYTSTESILSMPFTATNLAGTQNFLAHYHHPNSSESYYLNTTGAAFTKLNDDDARKKIFLTGTVSGVGTVYFVGKYTNFTSPVDYAPVIRYAEVLLNLAEAIVRGGNSVTQRAVDLLNAVRVRSYPAGVYTLASFPTVASFQQAVMDERNMEFLGEGIRNLDLMRTVTTVPAKGSAVALEPSSPNYIWPIPESELNINKLMTGN